MLNRKCLFGGGLGLGSTVIIAISASNVAVAESQRNQLNQIYWRFKANNIIYYQDPSREDAWIKDIYYHDSIINVIGKAIGDCVTGENEFKDKKVGDVITFKDTRPERYDRANWNAVVLYNLIEYTKRSIYYQFYKGDGIGYAAPENLERYEKVSFDQIQSDLLCYYEKYYREKGHEESIGKLRGNIEDAIHDIEKYQDTLHLPSILKGIMRSAFSFDLLNTRIGMIRDLRNYYNQAQQCLNYGKYALSRAALEVSEMKNKNRAEYKKLQEAPDEPNKEEKRRNLDSILEGTYKYMSKDIELMRKIRLGDFINELKSAREILSVDDKTIYGMKEVDEKSIWMHINAIRSTMSRILQSVPSIDDDERISKIHNEYKKQFRKTSLAPSRLSSNFLFLLKWRLQNGSRNLYLAPELFPIAKMYPLIKEGEDGRYKKLYFENSVDSQFEKYLGYTQKLFPIFSINDQSLALSAIRAKLPVQEINVRYVVSKTQQSDFTFGKALDLGKTCRLTTEDPICGSTMKLLNDLIEP